MKTPTNTACDLLLLAMIAHNSKKYDTAGSLFSAALAASDIEEVVHTLQLVADGSSVSTSSSTTGVTFAPHLDTEMSLPAIASILAAAMEEEDESQDEDAEDADLEESGDTADEDEEDEDEDEAGDGDEGADSEDSSDAEDEDLDDSTDDLDPDSPGDTLMPSSISTAAGREDTPGLVRVLAKRSRPNTAEDAVVVDEATPIVEASDEKPVPNFTSVLPAGRSPVSVRQD